MQAKSFTAKLSLDESEPARIARPRVIFNTLRRREPRIAARRTKDQNFTFVFALPARRSFVGLGGFVNYCDSVLRDTFWPFFPPARPNRLRLPSAQTSTTAPATMTTSPSLAWPSPSRPKSSCTSKRLVPLRVCLCAH